MPGHSIFLLFDSIHDVLRAEKTLRSKGLPIELVPVPRNLSSDCGMSVRVDSDLTSVAGDLSAIGAARAFVFDGTAYTPVDIGG